MTVFAQIVVNIIQQQEAIIGPIAVDQAQQVKGMKIDWDNKEVDITGDPQKVLDGLVEQYKVLFGQIAVETCKEAASKLLPQIPADQHPKSLK